MMDLTAKRLFLVQAVKANLDPIFWKRIGLAESGESSMPTLLNIA